MHTGPYPEPQQEMVRRTLARNVQAVVVQRLLPRQGQPGRVPVNEILIGTPRVRQMILEGRVDLSIAIEAGRDIGMQTMDDALVRLCERGVISRDLAWFHMEDRNRIRKDPDAGGQDPQPRPEPNTAATEETAGSAEPVVQSA